MEDKVADTAETWIPGLGASRTVEEIDADADVYAAYGRGAAKVIGNTTASLFPGLYDTAKAHPYATVGLAFGAMLLATGRLGGAAHSAVEVTGVLAAAPMIIANPVIQSAKKLKKTLTS